MKTVDLLPASALALLVVATLAVAELLPSGTGMVLVRLGPDGIAGFLGAPGMADVALVNLPAPGFAVLRGDASRIRLAFGSAIAWRGRAPCSFRL